MGNHQDTNILSMAMLGPFVTSDQDLDQMFPGSWPLIRGIETKVHTDLQKSKLALFKSKATAQIDSGPHE